MGGSRHGARPNGGSCWAHLGARDTCSPVGTRGRVSCTRQPPHPIRSCKLPKIKETCVFCLRCPSTNCHHRVDCLTHAHPANRHFCGADLTGEGCGGQTPHVYTEKGVELVVAACLAAGPVLARPTDTDHSEKTVPLVGTRLSSGRTGQFYSVVLEASARVPLPPRPARNSRPPTRPPRARGSRRLDLHPQVHGLTTPRSPKQSPRSACGPHQFCPPVITAQRHGLQPQRGRQPASECAGCPPTSSRTAPFLTRPSPARLWVSAPASPPQ